MKAMIITPTGVSLLVNRVEKYLYDKRQYDQEFLECLISTYRNPRIGEKVESLLKYLDPGEFDKLVEYLTIRDCADNLNELSAETKSLSLIRSENSLASHETTICFLTSNTIGCKACATALKNFYSRKVFKVEISEITNLNGREDDLEQGLRQLMDKTFNLAENSPPGTDIFINATAGYKPETAYVNLCALLLDQYLVDRSVNVYYAHELFRKTVCMPRLPVSVDFELMHLNATKIRLILDFGNKEAYCSLPLHIKKLFIKTHSGYELNAIGNFLWEKYRDTQKKFEVANRRYVTDSLAKKPELQNKILGFINIWEHAWTGMQVPQMINHTQAHCQNMLRLAEQLLIQLPENFLCFEEVYFLIASIWLHDIGHSETFLCDYDSGELKYLKSGEIREYHNELSYQRIKKTPEYFGFDGFDGEAEIIALLCKCHRKKVNLEKELKKEFIYEEKTIRLKLLIGLLRLIDACDIGTDRIGDEHFRAFRLQVTDNETKKLKELKKGCQDEDMLGYLQKEIKFLESTKAHFDAHAKIKGVSVVVHHKNKVQVILPPEAGCINVLQEVNELVNFIDKILDAGKIINQASDGMIAEVISIVEKEDCGVSSDAS